MSDPNGRHSFSGYDGYAWGNQRPHLALTEHAYEPSPLQTISETLRTAKLNANTLVLYAKKNPSVQRLVNNYEEWENNLRKEAETRLGGFKPLQQLLDSNAEDWQLLKKVKSQQPLFGGSYMKRCASEGSLTASEGSSSKPQGGTRVIMRSDWDVFSSGFSTEHEARRASRSLDEEHPIVVPGSSSGNGMPRSTTAPALRDSIEEEMDEASSTSGSSTWSADEGARQLEAVAVKLIQQSRQAIQNAQQTLQETANNCQQNLQVLGAILQQGVQQVALPGPDGPGSPTALQLVPWRSGSAAALAAGSGSGTPLAGSNGQAEGWELVPRYMLPPGELSDPVAAAGATSGEDEEASFYSHMSQYLDSIEQQRKRQRRSLRDPDRNVAIVTTASLPWMTGTAVNPLLRAAYLSNNSTRKVTLLLPWLSKTDQERVFPNSVTFECPEDQEAFVREWAQKRTGLACDFKVKFYPGRYAPEKGSILPVGDITQYIPDQEADVAVLEEPEHLNWYHHGRRWTDKFSHVVGVMHTNYLDYARREEGGALKELLLKHINAWVCRVYCHKVIKLSDAVQPLPRQETMFVHGVSPTFLRVGETKAEQAQMGEHVWSKGAYFLGKVLWAKGYTELLDRMKEYSSATGDNLHVDVYGAGPDLEAVQEEAGRRRLNLAFNGPKDHADHSLQDYKVFINPSLSDVVATTTAEALAMGKYVVCADHPSNRFFAQFPNCLVYRSPDEFSRCLSHAMTTEPTPLSPDQLQALTWEAATERFLQVGELTAPKPAHEELLDNVLAGMHQVLTGCEPLRIVAGAGSNTKVAPARVVDYVPCEDDVGGLFDDASRAKKAYAKTKALATGVAAAAGAGSSSSSGSGGGNGLALPAN